jgi:hypothetical protein
MIEKQIFDNKNNIKGIVTSSQNVLMNDKDLNKNEYKAYESIKERNKEAKKRIIIINEKEDITSSSNSKRSNEKILLLKKKQIKFEQ